MKKDNSITGQKGKKIVDALRALFGLNKSSNKQENSHTDEGIEKPVEMLRSLSFVWIESPTLKAIMKKSVELENGLWEYASMRFAMNLLGRREPYSQWEQNIFIQWLAAGEIKLPNENGWIDLEDKVGVLVTGTAALHDGSTIIKSPASLTGSDYTFSKDARVFLRKK